MTSREMKNQSDGENGYSERRLEMVERSISARGVRDELVLDAMRKVPRELFLPEKLAHLARSLARLT